MRKTHYPDPEIIGPAKGHERRVRSRFWKTVRKAISAIPFIDEVVAAYYCALDPATPTAVRATLFAALTYFVMPLDVLPDFVLGLGFSDDITVLVTAISMVRRHIGDRHRAAARTALGRLAAEKTG
ncbi:MAG: hypothetical protein H6Q99_1841 [Proteobacteria bacterium]|nr:hypothetical protein [Pseudomonadota bacterium]